jgi:hypothetical protein
MNPNPKPSPSNRITATKSGALKSRWALDFRRSPDAIFALGVGILALYYAGWGVLKLIQLLKG